MADGVSVQMDDAELQRALRKLGGKIKAKHTVKVLRKASRPIWRDAQRRVPVRTGALRESLKIRQRTYRGEPYVFVGVNPETEREGDGGKKIKPSKYAHLVEFGTADSDAKPFLMPAFASNKDRAIQIAREGLTALVAKVKG